MAASIDVQESTISALKNASWKHKGLHGFLAGRRSSSGIEVLFPTYCTSSNTKDVLTSAAKCNQLLQGGYELCGVILAVDEQSGEPDLQSAVENDVPSQLLDAHEGQSIVVCWVRIGSRDVGTEKFVLYDEDKTITQCQVRVIEEDVLSNSVVFKLKANIPVTICVDTNTKDWKQSIASEISRVSRSISSPASVYSVRDTGILLTDDGVKGVAAKLSCDKLYQHVQSEDGHVTRSKKKAKEQGPLGVDLFLLVSGESGQSDVPCCSPVLHHSIGDFTSAKMTLPLNVLSIVRSDSAIGNLHNVFTTAIVKQLEAMRNYLIENMKGEKIQTPEVFHFRPKAEQSFVSVVYPKSAQDEDLENQRRDLHQLLMQPTNRPVFRRNNGYMFPGEPTPSGYLLNPHQSLPTTGRVGRYYLVSGTYSYHHYMQDRFDDNHWGCAYRSLQTLVSWFRFQGYTDKPVPAHKEIQQALVDVGDKQKGFIGSKKWIGSMEVSFCLDQLIGVTCKIMNVSSGADLAGKGRELSSHFTNQGTPIMIGGGVLAHTILGVDFDEVTGNIRFLILDPHYTGSEDLKVILDKGWCGWKGADFWDANAHYNLCMPQTPNVF